MERSLRGQKTICIPIASASAYGEIVEERAQFQEYLDETIQLHPELFPPQIQFWVSFLWDELFSKAKSEVASDSIASAMGRCINYVQTL